MRITSELFETVQHAPPREGWWKPHVFSKRLWVTRWPATVGWFVINLHDFVLHFSLYWRPDDPVDKWHLQIGLGPMIFEVFYYPYD